MAQELKAFKLGSVELGEYWAYDAEEVDAVLAEKDAEIRRLQRALWLARADTADSFSCMFRTLEDVQDFDERTYWIFGNKWKIVFSKLKCCLMKTASSWGSIWDTVAHKCQAKAEEYK